MTPRAVVFDVDGVLVDSEPHSQRAWVAVLARYGSSVTLADVESCTGLGFEATYSALTATTDDVPDAAALWPELLEELEVSFASGLARFEDAADALQRLAFSGVPVAVATASPRSRLDVTLRVSGLGRYVGASAAGDEVARPKPAPDVYLLAAKRLGIPPDGCVAVEDTVTGAQAAIAAGMRTLGVARDPGDAGGLLAVGAAVGSTVDYETIAAWLV